MYVVVNANDSVVNDNVDVSDPIIKVDHVKHKKRKQHSKILVCLGYDQEGDMMYERRECVTVKVIDIVDPINILAHINRSHTPGQYVHC